MKINIKKSGFSLIEVAVALVIFGLLLSVILNAVINSDRIFNDASNQIDRQQESRRAVDQIAWELRNSNPSWDIAGTVYSISINPAGDELIVYIPDFNANGDITHIRQVRYYLGGLNNSQLLRVQGAGTPTVVANDIDIGAAAANTLFSIVAGLGNSIVEINIPIRRNNISFTLSSRVNLRNQEITLDPGVVPEVIPPVPEG